MAGRAFRTPARAAKRTAASIRLRWDERGRLLAAACVCGVLLLVALLLPLAFRRTPEHGVSTVSDARSVTEEKAALFVSYWYGGEGGGESAAAPAVAKSNPDEETAAFCERLMARLTARCIDDLALSDTTPTGSEYTVVTGADGTELRLCRMWLQTRGDWQNWLDACFDAETGTLYYLYVSRECLTNMRLYAGAERPGGEAIAAMLAEPSGGSVRYFTENLDGGTAVISTEGGILCYQINEVYYDALIDVRVNCV